MNFVAISTHEDLIKELDRLLAEPDHEERPSTLPPPNPRQAQTVRPGATEER